MKRYIILLSILTAATLAISDTITGRLSVNPNIRHTSSGASSLTETIDEIQKWTMGTSVVSQIDELWVQSVTLTGNESRVFDLYGGLTNSFGQTFNFDAVKFIAVTADSSNMTSVGIGGAASNQWASWCSVATNIQLVLPNTGFYIFSQTTNGYAVSNSSADILSVTNYHATSNAIINIILGGISN